MTTVTTKETVRIEQETVKFTESLLNGHQDKYLQDTGETFRPDYTHLEDFLSNLSQLSQTSKDGLVEQLSEDEVKEVVKSCMNGKSPGLDGITYEFYKCTWDVIGSTITQVFQAQLDRERLMESGRHGATCLISKVEGIPDVTQLRPITLLQTDYRILSKCLAVRLHSVIEEVVDPGQLGTGGRNILTGVYNIISTIDFVDQQNIPAFVASWDSMKAYDRASVVYLDKVTERMEFPPMFRSWIKMLHHGATTRLILPSGLSREIPVSFSFRQGDCIAGDLFCLNQEPLLRMLRQKLKGLRITNFKQNADAYMDDIMNVSSDVEDLVTFNTIFTQFEAQSGAMLSRDQKSKVMGLGQWRGKMDWPLEWIQTVSEMKILGFKICPQYSDSLKSMWDGVFRGFQRTLFAWESRVISSLQQRVDVAQIFGLSKLWYTAQVLPLPHSYTKKIESALSAFIFKGRNERLKLCELENSKSQGGLGLICVATKAECLLLRQGLRIIARPEEKCFHHLGYWLGNFLQEPFPGLSEKGPSCFTLSPRFPLHQEMLVCLEEGFLRNEFKPSEILSASTKVIYASRITDVVPPPKIEKKYPNFNFLNLVYPRLNSTILESESKDILFTLVHDFFYTKQRMFQQHRVQDPFCPVQECQGKVQDREHLFTSCVLVAEAWVWLRTKLLQLLPTTVGASGITSEDFILLQFPKDTMDKECVWLLGNYCEVVCRTVIGKKRKLKAEQLAGTLRARLQRMKNRAVIQPGLFIL